MRFRPCASPRPRALLAGLAGVSLVLSACGKRGDPLPPFPKTPGPITGLKLSQRGGELRVELTAPKLTTAGQRLPVLEVEVLRALEAGDLAKVATRSRSHAAPGELLRQTEPLPPPGTTVRVAARALSKGQASTLTAVVTLTVWPPLPAPESFGARVVGSGVELAWTMPSLPNPPPQIPATTAPPTSLRPGSASPAEVPSTRPATPTAPSATVARTPDQEKAEAAGSAPAATPPPPPAPGLLIYRRDASGEYGPPLTTAAVEKAPWIDTGAVVGQSYCYLGRVAVSTEPVIEGPESNQQCVEFRDIAPPPTPVGLAALSREGAVELSWSPVTSADASQIRLYRAEAPRPPVLLAELPPGTTSFRDATVAAGVAYTYTLTAVDEAGNESPPSIPGRVRLP
jgi:hypothetical protein